MKLIRQCTRKSPLNKQVFSLSQDESNLHLEFRTTDLTDNKDECLWYWTVPEDLYQTVLNEGICGDLFNLYHYIGYYGRYIKRSKAKNI